MFLTIVIAFLSLICLIVLHELGHFVIAKKFGVKVEEFGIGFPPRLWGKKFGETLYSINLLPFGAFVKIPGEIEKIDDPRAFSSKPIWQRALIVFGGVLSFWLVSVILLTLVMGWGVQMAIDDETKDVVNPRVQIAAIATGSPAETAGLRAGDTVKEISIFNNQFSIDKVKDFQELAEKYKGEKITLTIERGGKTFETSLIPRSSPPAGEGPIGIALVRTALKSYPWYQAPWEGVKATGNLTVAIFSGWVIVIERLVKGMPTGAQLMGPVGIFHLISQMSQLGVVYFIQFIAIISLYLAVFNLLPIPAVDGGKLLFLGIEAVRKKSLPQKFEQGITAFFFGLLILLMIWATIKDISRLF